MGIFRIALVVQICLLLAACGASQRGAAGPIALASVDPLSVLVNPLCYWILTQKRCAVIKPLDR